MKHDYRQVQWDDSVADDCRQLIRLTVREDLGRLYDWTTLALVPAEAQASAVIAARKPGVVAGVRAIELAVHEYDPRLTVMPHVADGDRVVAGGAIAELSGSARSMLAAERPILNLLGHMSGVATLARAFVDAVAGTKARIYDTRKTLPGYRLLDKYAVRCGGATNHRTGLFDGILIKDNHLALGAHEAGTAHYTPAVAVRRAREFLAGLDVQQADQPLLVEIEVDGLEALPEVLAEEPDVVLLDNFPVAALRAAVAMRDAASPGVELEASGGIRLENVAEIARAGVDRISVGGITHSAAWFDVGLDWR
ncbi:MAG TPA: carboxylating nicotinate-nucleotide diphosphorylase [Pirellulales bacterium]|jgi:nicotinate-nucleotide pyrophosphorylase (carboxylating)|nr:carboxylating nicotinate-nucleotide diphosphorylase [Pirellulales bacterium]